MATAGALAVALAAGACASLPTSGSVPIGTLPQTSGPGQPGIEVLPAPPGLNWTPQQIVSGFLAASASVAGNHAVARQYLARSFRDRWRPRWAATLISSPRVTQRKLPTQPAANGQPDAQVDVTGSYTATMSTGTVYQAGNLVATAQPQTFAFALTKIDGQWRIQNIYLRGVQENRLLLLAQPDFERNYQARDQYYYPADSAASVLVPDQAYIPLGTSPQRAVKGMVNSLLNAPSANSWLAGAVVTAFPRGTRVLDVHVIGVEAVVDLGGAAVKATRSRLARMAAQIYWTLTSQPYSSAGSSQIRSVQLEINHRKLRPMLPGYDASWVPRGQWVPHGKPPELYAQVPSGKTGTAVKIISPAGTAPVVMPAALSGVRFSMIAVSPGPPKSAVLAACLGKQIYLVPQRPDAPAVTEHLAAACTSMSWDTNQNLWVSAGNSAYVLPGAGDGGQVRPAVVPVECPAAACAGKIAALSVAPDGVRVAILTRTRKTAQVILAAISKSASFTYLGLNESVVSVGSDIVNPVTLTWLDPDHLLVVGDSEGRSQIYSVPLTGGSSTPVAAPAGLVTWIAANWTDSSDLPDVVAGVAPTGAAPASIFTARAGLLDRGWALAGLGSTPVYGG